MMFMSKIKDEYQFCIPHPQQKKKKPTYSIPSHPTSLWEDEINLMFIYANMQTSDLNVHVHLKWKCVFSATHTRLEYSTGGGAHSPYGI